MRPIHLFDLSSQHMSWLSNRQALVAGNIANINTPGYRALDLEAFDAVLESTSLEMTATARGHMAPDPKTVSSADEVEGENSWDVYHSGSNVSLEQELVKAGEVNRSYALNTNILKAFHRMLTSSARAT